MPGATLPFKEQIAFFRAKKSVLTDSYLDVFGAQHDAAFMVAGANRDDLLADFRQAIDQVIAEGKTLQQFRDDFDRIVAQYGWDYTGGRNWRSRIIYETNLRQSYNAGRWAQLQAAKATRPYWRYRHNDYVHRPRPLHVSWDGLVLSAEDAWWETHFPANGWGCQCYVESLGPRDLARLGKDGPDTAPPVTLVPVVVGQRSPGGPRAVLTPEGIDPGFAYAPGRSLSTPPARTPTAPKPGVPNIKPPTPKPAIPTVLVNVLARAAQTGLQKTLRLLAVGAAAYSAWQLLQRARAPSAIDAGFAQWQQSIADGDGQTLEPYLLGALSEQAVTSISGSGYALPSVVIAARSEAWNSLVERAGVWRDVAEHLPSHLRHPRAVLFDRVGGQVLYVVDDGGRWAQITVGLNPAAQAPNTVRFVGAADLAALRGAVERGEWTIASGALP